MKWTLVTGGSKRLGAAICRSLAAEGYPILIHYCTSRQEAEEVAAECRNYGVESQTIQGDFSSLESTLKFVTTCQHHYPDIKFLINNVGNYLIKSASKTSPEEWNALFQVNVNAPFALCQAFISSLQSCQGSIVNIGVAGANQLHADIKRTAYLATKMSLLMLTKSLARELASTGVRVNMVSPGVLENAVDLSDVSLPLQRPASLEEVVRVVSFLLNDANRYITGQNIEVSGGIGLLN
jgi:NAD(P)-dependent dehydrogenase (short-subunit alcohol dehydrogenase family)